MSKISKRRNFEIPIRKGIKIGNTLYLLEYSRSEIKATIVIYPSINCKSYYGTTYTLGYGHSRRRARIGIREFSSGWPCCWLIGKRFIRKEEARKFMKEIKVAITKAEDKTPDVAQVFSLVKDFCSKKGEEK